MAQESLYCNPLIRQHNTYMFAYYGLSDRSYGHLTQCYYDKQMSEAEEQKHMPRKLLRKLPRHLRVRVYDDRPYEERKRSSA